jgi:hypothetical protein
MHSFTYAQAKTIQPNKKYTCAQLPLPTCLPACVYAFWSDCVTPWPYGGLQLPCLSLSLSLTLHLVLHHGPMEDFSCPVSPSLSLSPSILPLSLSLSLAHSLSLARANETCLVSPKRAVPCVPQPGDDEALPVQFRVDYARVYLEAGEELREALEGGGCGHHAHDADH